MPSMIGMRMSVSRRSKAPLRSVRRSRASPPSIAVSTSWPSISRPRFRKPRIGSSSSTRRMRAMSGPAEQVGFGVEVIDDADKGQLPEGMSHIHAIADHEHVRAREPNEIGIDRHGALAGLLEQNGGQHLLRA